MNRYVIDSDLPLAGSSKQPRDLRRRRGVVVGYAFTGDRRDSHEAPDPDGGGSAGRGTADTAETEPTPRA